jgi:hypothetical protein
MTTYSVPVPYTVREVGDWFTGIFVGAPDFVFLNSCVTYTITLDMMMNALVEGITSVMQRTKSADAAKAYEDCLSEVAAIHELYRSDEVAEAQRRIQTAQRSFLDAGKRKRSGSE